MNEKQSPQVTSRLNNPRTHYVTRRESQEDRKRADRFQIKIMKYMLEKFKGKKANQLLIFP